MNDVGTLLIVTLFAVPLSGIRREWLVERKWWNRGWWLLCALATGLLVARLGWGYALVIPGSEWVLEPLLIIAGILLIYGWWDGIGTGGAEAEERG